MCEVIPNRAKDVLVHEGLRNPPINHDALVVPYAARSLKSIFQRYMPISNKPRKCPKCAGINAAASKECEWCGYAFESKKYCKSCAGENDLIASKCEWCSNPMEAIGLSVSSELQKSFTEGYNLLSLYSAPPRIDTPSRYPIYKTGDDMKKKLVGLGFNEEYAHKKAVEFSEVRKIEPPKEGKFKKFLKRILD